jgi:dinuclear metal center YbgI/SA1388 family protein
LIKNDLNLFAYHLPLDAHPELGNNAGLAAAMGWEVSGRFGEKDIGWLGQLPDALALGELADQLTTLLQRPPLLIGNPEKRIRRLAWCSGGAQGYFEQAVAAGVDLYLSGEISEPTVHLARESGVAYLACGHHATERFGVMALARHLRVEFGLECEFVDIPNPV